MILQSRCTWERSFLFVIANLSLSESKGQKAQYGIFAYGGAGVVLSRPLIDDINRNCTSLKTTNSS
jgi:hypothetical protein